MLLLRFDNAKHPALALSALHPESWWARSVRIRNCKHCILSAVSVAEVIFFLAICLYRFQTIATYMSGFEDFG